MKPELLITLKNTFEMYGIPKTRIEELIADTKKALHGSSEEVKEVQAKIAQEENDAFEDVKSTLDEDSDNWDDEFQSRDSGL